MEKYISKDALVAEIEKLIDEIYAGRPFDSLSSGQQTALWYVKSIMSSINTLEVKEVPIWEKVSPDTGQTTLYKDGGKSYLERFGYRIDLKDLDKLPKKNLKAQKGE